MKPLKYHPSIIESDRLILGKLFEEYYNKYAIGAFIQVEFPLGSIVRINWACKWNKVSNVGKTGVVIATNDEFCIVQITSGKKADRITDIYRCEDVDDIAEEIKTVQLIQSLGLPTYKL